MGRRLCRQTFQRHPSPPKRSDEVTDGTNLGETVSTVLLTVSQRRYNYRASRTMQIHDSKLHPRCSIQSPCQLIAYDVVVARMNFPRLLRPEVRTAANDGVLRTNSVPVDKALTPNETHYYCTMCSALLSTQSCAINSLIRNPTP
jgi:hypothetical protein